VSTEVVLERSMARPSGSDAVGRGATVALNCTMCHGAKGMSGSDAPNLAGQYPEVVVKQMHDYKSGKRASPIMEAIGKALPDRAIADLAAYYAQLPKARTAPTTYDEPLPALVRVGDPLRNIAPCISCHGGVDQKFGTPWLEGMPMGYLVAQLEAFASQRLAGADAQHGARHDAARDPGSRRLLRAQGGQRRAVTVAAPRARRRRTLHSNFPSRSHLVATHFSPESTGAPPCSVRVVGWGRS
jgi:cytochrome c553